MSQISCAVFTNAGKIRRNNEDNYFVNGKYKESNDTLSESHVYNGECEKHIFAVFDGMGGEELGEVASMIAAKTLAEYQSSDFEQFVGGYIEKANNLICDEINKNGGTRVGTTFALLYIDDNHAISYNIGDSRVYLFRENRLIQLSKDHTHIQMLVDGGIINEDAARTHKDRHILTQCLGISPSEIVIEPFISSRVELMHGDIFLLCSDGLTDMVDHKKLVEILVRAKSNSKELASLLVSDALKNGGKDNVTVVIVKIHR